MGNELIILFNIYMLKHVSVKIWAEKMFCSGKRQLVELNGRQNSHWNEIKLQRNSDSVTEMQIKLKQMFLYILCGWIVLAFWGDGVVFTKLN